MLSKLIKFYTDNKSKVITYVVIGFAFVAMALYIVDLKRQNKALNSQNSTMDEKFKQIGEAYQAQGQIYKTDKEAAQAAAEAQGKKLAEAMADANAKLRALFVANGEIKAELEKVKPVPVTPGPNGSFSNVALAQVRIGPSLTSVLLNYNPTSTDPNQRLTGSWLNNREDFVSSVGEWQKKDKGYIATMRLTRTVYDNQGKQVGTEEVPLTNATATFGPISFGGEQAVNPVPRFTIFGGIGKDTSLNKYTTVLGADYRFTNTLGVGGGIAGSTVFGTVSYRFGK